MAAFHAEPDSASIFISKGASRFGFKCSRTACTLRFKAKSTPLRRTFFIQTKAHIDWIDHEQGSAFALGIAEKKCGGNFPQGAFASAHQVEPRSTADIWPTAVI
jgi:hypothetical protein